MWRVSAWTVCLCHMPMDKFRPIVDLELIVICIQPGIFLVKYKPRLEKQSWSVLHQCRKIIYLSRKKTLKNGLSWVKLTSKYFFNTIGQARSSKSLPPRKEVSTDGSTVQPSPRVVPWQQNNKEKKQIKTTICNIKHQIIKRSSFSTSLELLMMDFLLDPAPCTI